MTVQESPLSCPSRYFTFEPSGAMMKENHPPMGGSSSVAERQLPKLNVAGSIPVSRSRNSSSPTLLIPDNRLLIRYAGVHVYPPGPSSKYKRFRALDQKGSLRGWLLDFRVISAAFQLSAPKETAEMVFVIRSRVKISYCDIIDLCEKAQRR
jgi:hypothetical protein